MSEYLSNNLPSMDELNRQCVETYVAEHGKDLGPRERQEAAAVAKAAYTGQTTLRDAGEAGIRYVKGKR